jgi:hypothetical protein
MFQPPGTLPHDDSPSVHPPVWLWYRLYVVLMALLYVGTAVTGGLYLAGAGFLPGISSADQAMFVVYGVLMLGMGIVFAGVYGAAPFLPKKRWAWFYHTVLICIGMSSCCCMPFCIPLLIYWIKPDAKSMFHVS